MVGCLAVNAKVLAQESVTWYINLDVIDGTGAPLREDMALRVEAGRMTDLLPMAEWVPPVDPGIEVYDAEGRYAIPGLVDTHVHLATVPEQDDAAAALRRQLYGGITAARDMAGDVRVLAGIARDTRLDRMTGPDVYYSALMAGESFFQDPRPASSARGAVAGQVPWMQTIDAETDMPLAVAMARGTWATGIKVYANLPAERVAAITAEAHRQGISVWAHSTVFPASPAEVVDAGVDVISHVCRLVFETTAAVPETYHHDSIPDYAGTDPADPRILAVFDAMREQGTVLDATLGLYGRIEARYRDNQADAAKPFDGCPPRFAAALVAQAVSHGVTVSTGSDFVNPPEDEWPALHDELRALAGEAGMTPLALIQAATQVGARVLGIDGVTGTLEPGKRADFVLLGKNPLDDITHIDSIEMTVKHGRRYPRSEYLELDQEQP
ncbi:amidohydrolase family protein [Marinihelvus fidelis]|uniref:amidohydrolase family protein n=1 Tax=Marinihelvus fidelis TaxID=2613842 RepID=UPI00177E8DF8|nr:amidohydrolase family protein [Marinihelvus fidelis]